MTDSFMVFQKEVHEYVLANYKNSSDITYIVNDLKVTLPQFMKHMPNLRNLKEEWGIYPMISETYLTKEYKSTVKNIQEILVPERNFPPNASPRWEIYIYAIHTYLGIVHSIVLIGDHYVRR